MALLGAESFDFYGTSIANLQLRGYLIGASNNLFVRQNASIARTGLGYVESLDSGNRNAYLTKTLDAPVTTGALRQGVGIQVTTLPPSIDRRNQGLRMGSPFGFGVVVNPSQGFTAVSGTSNLGDSAPNIFVLNSWFWLEVEVRINNGGSFTGQIEVRYNYTTVLTVTGIDIPGPLLAVNMGGLSQFSYDGGNALYDDWVWSDSSGTEDNTFMGDTRCFTSYPNADTAQADWVPSSSPAYSVIDETIPNDAGYIQAVNAGDISEFGMSTIIPTVAIVRGIIPVVRSLKSDSGLASFKIGVDSAGSNAMSSDISPSTGVTYASTIITKNPNGNVPWDKVTATNVKLRAERTV